MSSQRAASGHGEGALGNEHMREAGWGPSTHLSSNDFFTFGWLRLSVPVWVRVGHSRQGRLKRSANTHDNLNSSGHTRARSGVSAIYKCLPLVSHAGRQLLTESACFTSGLIADIVPLFLFVKPTGQTKTVCETYVDPRRKRRGRAEAHRLEAKARRPWRQHTHQLDTPRIPRPCAAAT